MGRGFIPFDKRALGGAECLVGIDEAGRGSLAGPVVAAAVLCTARFYAMPWCRTANRMVDDSKRLRPERRAAVVERFREACHEKWIQIGIGTADVAEIGRHNIHGATTLAMRRALAAVLGREPGWDLPGTECPVARGEVAVIIDGRPIRAFPCRHTAVVKGDQRSLAISLAGIHAKEWRDARMRELDADHPAYGFAENKGYGTRRHLEELRRNGPTPHHRALFIRKALAGRETSARASEDSLFQEGALH